MAEGRPWGSLWIMASISSRPVMWPEKGKGGFQSPTTQFPTRTKRRAGVPPPTPALEGVRRRGPLLRPMGKGKRGRALRSPRCSARTPVGRESREGHLSRGPPCPHPVSLAAAAPAGRTPSGYWPGGGSRLQRDAPRWTARSRRRSQPRRCPPHMSAGDRGACGEGVPAAPFHPQLRRLPLLPRPGFEKGPAKSGQYLYGATKISPRAGLPRPRDSLPGCRSLRWGRKREAPKPPPRLERGCSHRIRRQQGAALSPQRWRKTTGFPCCWVETS